LRGTLLLTAGISVLGLALTFVLPEPAGRSLDEIATDVTEAATLRHEIAAEVLAS
jgi:hypothetical protein